MNTEYWLSEARLLEPYDLMVFASSVLQILFSTPREENWGFTVPFYSVQDCSLWNRRFFFVFFRRAEESAKRGWRASCARLALKAWAALACTHPKNAKKQQQQQQRLLCKIRRNGRKLEKTMGDGWYKLCLFTWRTSPKVVPNLHSRIKIWRTVKATEWQRKESLLARKNHIETRLKQAHTEIHLPVPL